MEFTGITINRLESKDAGKKEIRKAGVMKGYRRIEDTAKNLYNEYKSSDNITHQYLANKYGITRRSVITYIQQYELENEKEKIVKKSSGRRRKIGKQNTKAKFDKNRLMDFLILDKNNNYVFKENWTLEKVANVLDVTEITVSKYKNKLNENH